jgi:high-affinity Fe2+/Pb2+ permease
MSALSVDSAKNLAIVVAVVFLVLSVVSAIVIKNVVTKLILVVLLGGLALGAWSQRSSLSDCADRAQEELANGTVGTGSVTCKFFGSEVDIPAP